MRSFLLRNSRSDHDRPRMLRRLFVLEYPEGVSVDEGDAWATWKKLPFFEPYNGVVGMFLLDQPESAHLQQWRGYITTR
jgi:hypothetical protein